jgi:hypothetical protein
MRSRKPSPAMLVALLALFVALGGSSYAALQLPRGSVGTKQLKNNAVISKKVRNNSLLLRDFRASQRSRLRGPQGERGAQGAPGPQGPAGVVGNLTVQRLDLPLNDNTNTSGSVPCPAGEKIIAGSVNISDATSADVNITVSRPAQGTNQLLPNSGEPFDRWRGAAVNPAGGTGNVTLRVWAICTPGTQQSVPGTGTGPDD